MLKPLLLTLAVSILSIDIYAAPSLTIYNGNFAVVRDQLTLPLKKGINEISYQNITQKMEADSLVLRANSPGWQLNILEQNYLSQSVTQSMLLHQFEGQSIDFEVKVNDQHEIKPGKIIRSGYGSTGNLSPIIEINGKTQFGLPGKPLFPPLREKAILLKPTLRWLISANKSGEPDLELAYLTEGLNWKSDYNIIANSDSDKVDLIGWLTFNNQSGKGFENAKVKLMAGDINKVSPPSPKYRSAMATAEMVADTEVQQQNIDEYHLYTVPRAINLTHGETKQIEFIRASAIQATTRYVYDGAMINLQYRPSPQQIRQDANYGTQSSSDVSIYREFDNTKNNNLGVPLPAGRVRFYQQSNDKQLEFIGENTIKHTAKNELVSVYTGNAFDIKGERKRLNYRINNAANWASEEFEISITNRKETPVTVEIIEHLYRWVNWTIENSAQKYELLNSDTVRFTIKVGADQTEKLKYTVKYSW